MEHIYHFWILEQKNGVMQIFLMTQTSTSEYTRFNYYYKSILLIF